MGRGCQKLLERRGGAGQKRPHATAPPYLSMPPERTLCGSQELRLRLAAVLQGSLQWRASRMKAALVYPCPWLLAPLYWETWLHPSEYRKRVLGGRSLH